MATEGYIFDLDGTLLDGSEELKMSVLFECIQSFGNQALIDFWFENPGYQSEALYMRGNNTQERFEPFITINPQVHGAIVRDFMGHFSRERKTVHQRLSASAQFSLHTDAKKCLEGLPSNAPRGIFTDSSRMQVNVCLEKCSELSRYFGDSIITQDDVPNERKPHPAGIQLLMRKMGIIPEQTTYVDDMFPGIQSAVSAAVNRIYWVDRNGITVRSRSHELNLLIQTGRVVRIRTLDILSQPRASYVLVMRGRQGVGKSTLMPRIPFPIATVSKDYVAEREGWNWNTCPDYNLVRDELYQKFTLSALENIGRYGSVCLDAPFTQQDDVTLMIDKIRAQYPGIPVIVATVTAPLSQVVGRMGHRTPDRCVGFMRRPQGDSYDTSFHDTLRVSVLPHGVHVISLSNRDNTSPEKVLRPLLDKVKSL